jgi:glutaredoxin 2
MKESIESKKVFQTSFDTMEDVFTSIEFLNGCRRLGLPEKVITNQSYQQWLTRKTNKLSKFVYQKNDVKTENKQINGDLDSAIQLLKSHGYKIQRPTTTFEEI